MRNSSGNINRDQDQRTESNDFLFVLFHHILFWMRPSTNNENLCLAKSGIVFVLFRAFISFISHLEEGKSGKYFIMICLNNTKYFMRILRIIGGKDFLLHVCVMLKEFFSFSKSFYWGLYVSLGFGFLQSYLANFTSFMSLNNTAGYFEFLTASCYSCR